MKLRLPLALLAAVTTLFAGLSTSAQAAVYTWAGGTADAIWDTTASAWTTSSGVPGPWVNSNDALFSSNATLTVTPNLDVTHLSLTGTSQLVLGSSDTTTAITIGGATLAPTSKLILGRAEVKAAAGPPVVVAVSPLNSPVINLKGDIIGGSMEVAQTAKIVLGKNALISSTMQMNAGIAVSGGSNYMLEFSGAMQGKNGMVLAFDVADKNTVKVSGVLSSNTRVGKVGAGTLWLTNAANAFGNIQINGGTVAFENAGAMGTGTAAYELNGGTMKFMNDMTVSKKIDVWQTENNKLDSNGRNITLSSQLANAGNFPAKSLMFTGGGKFIITGNKSDYFGKIVVSGTTVDASNGVLAWAGASAGQLDALKIVQNGKLMVSSLQQSATASLGQLAIDGQSLLIDSNGILQLTKSDTSIRTIRVGSGGGNLLADAGVVWTIKNGPDAATSTYGNIEAATAGASANVQLTGQGNFIIGSKVSIGTGKLIQSGTGTLELKNKENVYGELEINSGTVLVSEAGALKGKTSLMGGRMSSINTEARQIASALNISGSDVALGSFENTGILTFSGAVTANDSHVTLDSDVVFSGTVDVAADKVLKKSGSGLLTFSGSSVNALGNVEVVNGEVLFTKATALKGGVVSIGKAASVDLMGTDMSAVPDANGLVVFNQGGILKNADRFNGDVALTAGINDYVATVQGSLFAKTLEFQSIDGLNDVSYGRLMVEADLTIGSSITFCLNAGTVGVNPLVTANSVILADADTTKVEVAGSFDFWNADLYEGEMQLFSTGLTAQTGTLDPTTFLVTPKNDLFTFDSSRLVAEGKVLWKKFYGNAALQTPDQLADTATSYVGAENTYLGVQGAQIGIFAEGKTYDLNGQDAYRLTGGEGALIYAAALGNADVKILGYQYINRDFVATIEGSVTLTNVNNAMSANTSTSVTGSKLIVDGTVGALGALAPAADVKILGESKIYTYQKSTIELRTGGDQALMAGDYKLANEFEFNQDTTLVQTGANTHILSGNMTNRGATLIMNESDKDFVINSQIGEYGTAADLGLTLGAKAGSRLVLDGSSNASERKGATIKGVLSFTGSGVVESINDYFFTVRGLKFVDTPAFAGANGRVSSFVMNGGSLTIGNAGISNNAAGTGNVIISNGKIISTASWVSDVLLGIEGEGENILDTDRYNVVLAKGMEGTGSLKKDGAGALYVAANGERPGIEGTLEVRKGDLWLGVTPAVGSLSASATEYLLGGDLSMTSGVLHGMINANDKVIIFGKDSTFDITALDNKINGYIKEAGYVEIHNGAVLKIDSPSADWTTDGGEYTLVSTTGMEIDGQFKLDIKDFAFIDMIVNQSPNGITLTMKQKEQYTFSPSTSNEATMAPVVKELVDISMTSNPSLAAGELRNIMRNTVGVMDNLEFKQFISHAALSAASLTTAIQAQSYNLSQHVNTVLYRAGQVNPAFYDTGERDTEYSLWAAGTSTYRDTDADGNGPGFTQESFGATVGLVRPITEKFLFGMGFAYTNTKVNVKGNYGDNKSDVYNVDLYGRYTDNQWSTTVVLTGGWSSTDFSRLQPIAGTPRSANGSADGSQFMGLVEVGYDFYLDEEKTFTLKPIINVAAGSVSLRGFNETGDLGDAAYSVGKQTQDIATLGAGVELTKSFKTSLSDNPALLQVRALITEEMGDKDHSASMAYLGAPGKVMNISSGEMKSTAALITAAANIPLSQKTAFFVDVSGEFRSGQTGMSTTAGFNYQF